MRGPSCPRVDRSRCSAGGSRGPPTRTVASVRGAVAFARIHNVSRGSVVAQRARVADGPLRRLVGLTGLRDWAESDGLLVRPCRAIHTFFVGVPIDVVFVNRGGLVVDVSPARTPWRLGPVVWRARWAVELPAGAIEASRTRLDDLLIVESIADRAPE